MSNEPQCIYVTYDQMHPIRETLNEHTERFKAIDEWKYGVDRRASGQGDALKKICETLTSTEREVTARQDELTRKFDLMATENSKSEVKLDGISKTLADMSLSAAEEKGRKEEREKNEAEKRASFTRRALFVGSIYTVLQIIVIVTSYLKH